MGLPSIPDRATTGRWWRRYLGMLEEVFEWLSNLLRLPTPTSHLIADSTPLTVTIHLCFQALADAGCDSKSNIEAVEAMGAEPVIASNPRRACMHLTKKTSMEMTGLISLNAKAIKALLQGEPSLKAVS